VVFKVEEKRLRQLGLIKNSETTDHISEGPWTRDGMYYVSIIQVYLKDGQRREYVLKCPWDFSLETLDSAKATGTDLIVGHVEKRAEWSRKLRRLGVNAVVIKKYDEGTLIQENINGENLYEALTKMHSDEAAAFTKESLRILKLIENRLGLAHVNRVYASADRLDFAKDFVLTSRKELVLVNLDFQERRRARRILTDSKRV